VIRHELVHVFSREQTDFRVPAWLTEGLAVAHEDFPRPPVWVQILTERAAVDTLFDLQSIDAAFVRPRTAHDWTLAYCQAQLYVEYMSQKHGPKAITGLLNAFRDGRSTQEAIRE